jgi:hypothetical protein
MKTATCLSCNEVRSIVDADVCELCYAEIMGFELPTEAQLEHPEDAHSLRFNPYWDCFGD